VIVTAPPLPLLFIVMSTPPVDGSALRVTALLDALQLTAAALTPVTTAGTWKDCAVLPGMTAEYIGEKTTSKMLLAAVHGPAAVVLPLTVVVADVVLVVEPVPVPLPLVVVVPLGVELLQPPTASPREPAATASEPIAAAHTLIAIFIASPPYADCSWVRFA